MSANTLWVFPPPLSFEDEFLHQIGVEVDPIAPFFTVCYKTSDKELASVVQANADKLVPLARQCVCHQQLDNPNTGSFSGCLISQFLEKLFRFCHQPEPVNGLQQTVIRE